MGPALKNGAVKVKSNVPADRVIRIRLLANLKVTVVGRIVTARKLDGRDLGAPVEGLGDLVVLLRVPEGAAIRVESHRAVIAPAAGLVPGCDPVPAMTESSGSKVPVRQRIFRRPATSIEGYKVELDSL